MYKEKIMNMGKLRPCPFCQSRAFVKVEHGFLTIECTHRRNCLIRGTIMPLYPQGGIENLLSDWNGPDWEMMVNKEDDLK